MVTDHNITIYYHSKDGGGSFRLFRKVGDKSGERSTESKVRKDGSYIYEEFIDTKVIDFLKRKRELFKKGLKKKKKKNSEDVKVYTVGAYYAYAESRKSPTVDGKVVREPDGREKRYVVKLNEEEMEAAHKVVKAFNQRVCGFDLLRAPNGKVRLFGTFFVATHSNCYL